MSRCKRRIVERRDAYRAAGAIAAAIIMKALAVMSRCKRRIGERRDAYRAVGEIAAAQKKPPKSSGA